MESGWERIAIGARRACKFYTDRREERRMRKKLTLAQTWEWVWQMWAATRRVIGKRKEELLTAS